MIRGDHPASIRPHDGVAVHASVTRKHRSAEVELRCSGQRILVTLAAAGFNEARGQKRFFSGSFAVMRLGNCSGCALAAMTDDATESIQRVGNDGVLPERLLRHIGKTGLVQPKMAGSATVGDA